MPDYGDDRGFGRGVPQRVTRPTMRDVAGPTRNYNEGYRPGDVTVSNLPPRMPTPIQTGGRGGEFAPPLYSGRNPFIQPIQTGGRYGEFGGMDSGSYLSSRFGGDNVGEGTGLGSLESKIKPHDWRSIQKLLDRGIDPDPYIESVKWGPSPFPKPGQPFPKPWPPRPGGPDEWDIVERGDIQSDWRGQDRLWKNIIQANPGLGEDELMILFQQAMDRATG